MVNLNARNSTGDDSNERQMDQQVPPIRFPAFQKANQDGQTGGGNASIGVSTLLRSLGTISFIRTAPDVQDVVNVPEINTRDDGREESISSQVRVNDNDKVIFHPSP